VLPGSSSVAVCGSHSCDVAAAATQTAGFPVMTEWIFVHIASFAFVVQHGGCCRGLGLLGEQRSSFLADGWWVVD
jgi:hypothetical protein